MTDSSNTFLIEQFKTLRDEVARRQAARNRLEEMSILGIVAVYAWLATNGSNFANPIALAFAWWLPVAFSIFSFIRQRLITNGIDRAAEFNKKLTEKLGVPKELCWEEFVSNTRGGIFGGNRSKAQATWL